MIGRFRSAKLGEHYIVKCINPALFKMIDGTEKRKIPSKFVLQRYNEFRCNFTLCKVKNPLEYNL